MKAILCGILCLVCGSLHAEESRRAEMLRKVMKSYGWKTEDVTFDEVGRLAQPVIIKRSGDVVGYYFDESVWERREVETDALAGITKIVMGYDHPRSPKLFQIEDRDEIAVWTAAYRNHTEFERRFACFIPTTKAAGFEHKREEYQFGGACMCSLALRFYVDGKEVLELKGHVHEHPEIDSGMRNLVLHELAKAKLPKKPAKIARGGEVDFVDPFVDEPNSEEPKAEQDGAEQPATAPESKPEGEKKSKPESEGCSL